VTRERSALRRAWAVAPVVVLAAVLALSGCSRLGAGGAAGGTGGSSSSAVPADTASPTTGSTGAADSSSLDSIAHDLDAADTANQEASTNAAAGDQAAATNDDQ
jgi:hypothetical protein